ncbi:hypothetical protein PHYBLDRAFT_62229 [Phycomyces blakesleeanus NRRL 1555(-)]|uniref:Uncharacterized protein n=1 Tax=Phycomyces blakesleeanus (strain ATCC 8743b / DSM 1359 / FGSC 10004 / NBRC 33097 / NRRL 1555) TaxID=763407 RepID=A0A162UZG2_PHYB8|nr:hypothetical protein PHYBLDRAFT_62229 [Phycomyces blakesleeanus NRRL 1555(-)]OAD79002.1 hypothetical protein PHYBLDRAFT_62229 [Phycomyces blakesleeanus NRRL 1555(-)]|eukprot:XP_018297042.1 hypothetical protein PHYBLDRAFT_62229 [Phycomyces blakesleeanus NRRL 1555(-)]
MNIKDLLNHNSKTRTDGHMLNDLFVVEHSNRIEICIIAQARRKFNNRNKGSITAPIDFAKFLAAGNKTTPRHLRVRNLDRVYNVPVEHFTDYENLVPTCVSNSRAQTNNVSREVYDKCIKIVNKYMAELGSNGCCRFSTVEERDFISEDRYKVEKASAKTTQTFWIVPLSEQLRFKLAHPEKRAKIAYDTRCLADRCEDRYENIFSRDAVRWLLDCGVVGQNDVLFNTFKNIKRTSSVIHIINLNIDSKERYKVGNMIQLAIILRPNHSKDITSFLEPVLDDLRNLGANGLQFQTDSEPMYGVKGPNIFKDLPTMINIAFFGLGEIHLLGHSTGQQLYVALGGKFCPWASNSGRSAHGIHLQDWLKHHRYPFALDISLEDIDKAICTSRTNIPADFTGTAIGCWHVFLNCEIVEKRLKPTIFVMNQHMLIHLGYMIWEMDPLWAYSCRPLERAISVYSAAIKLRKKPGKNMENLLLRKAAINHYLGCQFFICTTNDRRASNFEVASNDVAGPQLWFRPTQSSLVELAATIGIECQNLVRSLIPFWAREGAVSIEENDEVVCINKMWKVSVVYRVLFSVDSRHGRANNLAVLEDAREYGFIFKFFSQTVNRVTRLFVAIDCISDVQCVNQGLFSAWDSLDSGVVKVLDMKFIMGIAGLGHDTNNETMQHIIWLSPKYYQ